MLDRELTKKQRLIQARNLFERTFEHYEPSRRYMEEDSYFYHNVDGTSQWETEDLRYLNEQGRPALTFNLIFNKVNQAIGLHEDHKHRVRVVPSSGSQRDIALAKVASALLDTARKCADMDCVDSQVYEFAVMMGEGNAHLSIEMDTHTPGWINFFAKAQTGLQVMWDIASESPYRLDARYVFWDKWMNLDEFIIEYPEFKHRAKVMMAEDWNGQIVMDDGAGGFESDIDDKDDYEAEFGDTNRTRYYANRKTRQIRLIHLEYETLVKKYFLIEGQQRKEIDEQMAKAVEKAQDQGDPRFVGKAVVPMWASQKFWFEFIGNDVLFDEETPDPHEEFSLSSMVCFLDSIEGYPYGIVRNMKDPQRDVNKAHSQSLDHLNTQAKPGWIAEQNAIPNPEEFEEANKRAQSVALVGPGAISGGQIQKREVPTYSEAANARLGQAVQLLDRVSGIASDPEDPARGVEAATTVAIRERKALRALVRVLRHFERYQIRTAMIMLEVIMNAMPDDQIQAWLGDVGEYRVDGKQILAVDEETGQAQPIASLRDFRTFKYAVELMPSSTSDTTRLMMLNIIMQLAATNTPVPIDPDLIYELITTDRATLERLRAFAKITAQQQAQASQQQLEIVGQQAQADMMEAEAKVGKAMADSKLEAEKISNDIRFKMLDLWLKADDSEKKFVTDILNIKATADAADQKAQQPSPSQE